jgi:site-specific DNA recombinase
MSIKAIRCAIYTRKSSEEGLEQSFNSLDAQRDACESYIRSQKHEGWIVLRARYDDGGFSGGNIERPGLQQLLTDIAAGEVDIVVVYKIDRLTRSLLDFSKIVEAFDKKGVSFVSVTQQFNTTTSMGRLTLNILLSFAQFEREITGERIRDKIAASKKKGMWMGGVVPFGYRLQNRQLVVDPQAAQLVREVFRQYLRLGCVAKLRAHLNHQQAAHKVFSRGALYHILSNRLYLGEIVHRKQVYRGKHQGIIDPELWGKVAAKLKENNPARNRSTRKTESSLLAGILFDAAGVRYTPTHAVKGGKRYRYYTSQSIIQHQESAGIPRIPASELERVVIARIAAMLQPNGMAAMLNGKRRVVPASVINRGSHYCKELQAGDRERFIRTILTRVTVLVDAVELEISIERMKSIVFGGPADSDSDHDRKIYLKSPVQFKARGNEIQIVTPASSSDSGVGSQSLVKAIARARAWYEKVIRGKASSFEELAKQEQLTARYVRRIFRCATLAPDIVESALRGQSRLRIEDFRLRLPLDWSEQHSTTGLSERPATWFELKT